MKLFKYTSAFCLCLNLVTATESFLNWDEEMCAIKNLKNSVITEDEYIKLKHRKSEMLMSAIDDTSSYKEYLSRHLPKGFHTEAEFNQLKTRRTEEFIDDIDTVSNYQHYLIVKRAKLNQLRGF